MCGKRACGRCLIALTEADHDSIIPEAAILCIIEMRNDERGSEGFDTGDKTRSEPRVVMAVAVAAAAADATQRCVKPRNLKCKK